MADGKVTISTALDNSSIEKDIGEVSGAFGGLRSVLRETSNAITEAFSRPVAVAQAKVRELEREYERVTAEFNNAKLADDDSAAERLGQQQIQVYYRILAARERLAIEVQAAAKKQAATEARQAEKAEAVAQKALGNTKTAAKNASKNVGAVAKSFDSAKKSVNKFGTRLKSIISGALVFNLISAGLREITSYMGKTLKVNNEFSQALAKLKGALLTAFQPIYEYVTPVLTTFINLLARAAQSVASFFASLTGKSIDQVAENAENLYNEADAIDGVGSAASAAKKQLAGFDEINKLGNVSVGTNSSTTSDAVSPSFTFDETSLSSVVDNFLETIDPQEIGEKVGKIINEVNWGNVFSVVGTTVSQVLTSAFEGINSVIAEVDWVEFGEELTDGLVEGLFSIDTAKLAGTIVELLISLTGAVLLSVWGVIKKLFDPQVWKTEIGPWLGNALKEVFFGALEGVANITPGTEAKEGALDEFWDKYGQYIIEWFEYEFGLESEFFETVKKIFSTVMNTLGGGIIPGLLTGIIAWGNDGDWWDWVEENIFDPFIEAFRGLFDMHSPSKVMESEGENITLGWLGGLLKPLKDLKAWLDRNIFGPFSDAFDEFAEGFKNPVNAVIGFINSMISAIVEGINSAIRAINKLSFTIPDWVPSIGGDKVGFNLPTVKTPQIPYLAQGAVLPANKPFLSVVGDQKHGTNVEAPLETIKQALAEVMAMQGGGDVTINFTGDLAQLARVLKPVIDRENRRVGGSMVRKGAF